MSIRIVLVEDHKLTRMGLKVAFSEQPDLELLGEAASGETGLAMLLSQRPDVAIVDIGLPDMDGIEVVRCFRDRLREDESVTTKVLMLTMHDSEDSVMAAFAAGADAYCMKQTDLSELMTAVRETYQGNSWIDPAIASIVLRQMRQQPVAVGDVKATIQIDALTPEYTQVLEDYPLTERELEILELIVGGCSNADSKGDNPLLIYTHQ
jgi:DNA-binding NarL/FixJ family response regulator